MPFEFLEFGPVVSEIRGGLEIAPPPPVGRVIKIPQWGAG